VARRVCDLENLVNEEAIARVGLQRHVKKNKGGNRKFTSLIVPRQYPLVLLIKVRCR
jgi:hypothetical protein